MTTGERIEFGMIGSEGIVGLPALLGREKFGQHVIVQAPLTALRMTSVDFKAAFEQSTAVRNVMLRYTGTLLEIASQTAAACNRLHSLKERYARWLLMMYDRLQSDAMPLTHEFLSMMLGVRRSRVTESAGELQRLGSVVNHRALTAAVIDSREFLAGRRRADTEALAPSGTRIAFTGGTDCNDHTRIWDTLDKIHTKHPDMVLMHGGSPRGAERIASCWADYRKVPQVVFKPDWTRDRNAAPFKRNDRMLEALPIGVVIFPGSGISANLADKAKKFGIPLWRFDKPAPTKNEVEGGAA